MVLVCHFVAAVVVRRGDGVYNSVLESKNRILAGAGHCSAWHIRVLFKKNLVVSNFHKIYNLLYIIMRSLNPVFNGENAMTLQVGHRKN